MVLSCTTNPPPSPVERPELVLVPNPGFEAPKEDWIQDWDFVLGQRDNAARDSQVFHTGSASLRLTGYAWAASRFLPYNGEEIHLAAWLKTDRVIKGKDPWARCGLSINGYDEAQRPITSHDVVRLDGTHDWQKCELQTILSGAVRYIRVMCFMDKDATGTAWFDDVDLVLRDWRDPQIAETPYDENRCTIEVAADKPLGPLNKVWAGADVGLAELIVLDPVRAALPRLRAAGINLLRFRETLNGLKIYSEGAGGKPSYDWTRLDRALAPVTRLGFTPVFVLGTTPDEIAATIGPRPWRNISPPRDLRKWGEIIFNVVKHCEERYGKAAVESWYWEVWNEPDSPQFFQGSQADYFALYDFAAAAVKRANPKARVGGPSGSSHAWVQAFAEHCAQTKPQAIQVVRGKNTASRGAPPQSHTATDAPVPVDFFSWHIYSADRGPAAIRMIDYSVQQARTALAAYPEFKDKELLITQWSLSPPPNDLADTNYAAAFVARSAERLLDLGIARSSFFCVADSPWSRSELFRGDDGLITSAGVDKPTLNAFRLLSMLGTDRLTMHVDAEPVSGIASAAKDRQRIAVLLSNYVDNPEANLSTDTAVHFTGLPFPAGSLHLRRFLVDASRSNAYDRWLTLGRPSRPTALDIRTLRSEAQLEIIQDQIVKVTSDGSLSVGMRLPEHSVTLIELERVEGDQTQ